MNAEAKPDRSGAAAGAGGTGAGAEVRITYAGPYSCTHRGHGLCADCPPEHLAGSMLAAIERGEGSNYQQLIRDGARAAANTGPRPVRVRGPGALRGQDERALPAGDWHETMPSQLVEARRVIAFDVLGTPAPKGSMRIAHFGGRAVLVPNSSTKNAREQRAWAKAIVEAADLACGTIVVRGQRQPVFAKSAALYVSMVFYLRRPKSAKNRARPNTKPDSDKFARLVGDALTGVLWVDDGQIVDLVASKHYANPGREGARITVTEARAM